MKTMRVVKKKTVAPALLVIGLVFFLSAIVLSFVLFENSAPVKSASKNYYPERGSEVDASGIWMSDETGMAAAPGNDALSQAGDNAGSYLFWDDLEKKQAGAAGTDGKGAISSDTALKDGSLSAGSKSGASADSSSSAAGASGPAYKATMNKKRAMSLGGGDGGGGGGSYGKMGGSNKNSLGGGSVTASFSDKGDGEKGGVQATRGTGVLGEMNDTRNVSIRARTSTGDSARSGSGRGFDGASKNRVGLSTTDKKFEGSSASVSVGKDADTMVPTSAGDIATKHDVVPPPVDPNQVKIDPPAAQKEAPWWMAIVQAAATSLVSAGANALFK